MNNDKKRFNVILPKEIWAYLKKLSVDTDKSMNEIIKTLIVNHKNKSLTLLNIDV